MADARRASKRRAAVMGNDVGGRRVAAVGGIWMEDIEEK